MDGRTEKNVTLAYPRHEGKWFSKFIWNPPSDLWGDSVTDKWTDDGRADAQKNNSALAYPYHEWKSSKFGWIPPSGLGGDSMTDR